MKVERDNLDRIAMLKFREISTNVCHYCKSLLLEDNISVDHLTPLSRGGKSIFNNFCISCLDCNSDKGNMTYSEYEHYKTLSKDEQKKFRNDIDEYVRNSRLHILSYKNLSIKVFKEATDLIPIKSIKIPKHFKKGYALDSKTMRQRSIYFEKTGTIEGVIGIHLESMTLISGYSTYILIKRLGLGVVPVYYISNKELIEFKSPFGKYKVPQNTTDIMLFSDLKMPRFTMHYKFNEDYFYLKEYMYYKQLKTIMTPILIDQNNFVLGGYKNYNILHNENVMYVPVQKINLT